MAKKSALIIGIIFLVVGILGFIPGNGIVGTGAYFEADAIHNVIHLIFGLILLWVALKATSRAATTLVWVGIIYILLAIIGFIQASGSPLLGFVGSNDADDLLHLVLGVVILALGWAGKKSGAPMTSASAPMSPQM